MVHFLLTVIYILVWLTLGFISALIINFFVKRNNLPPTVAITNENSLLLIVSIGPIAFLSAIIGVLISYISNFLYLLFELCEKNLTY